MAKCDICDKSVNYGNKLSITRSHISKRSPRTWKPNLRSVKAMVDGQPKKSMFVQNVYVQEKLQRLNYKK